MNWIQELTQKESLCCSLTVFLDQHGFSGLEKALQLYSNTQAEYICKTKAAVTRIKIDDIYYLEIQTHTITIHTGHATYQKYGSLADEMKFLAPYRFIRCRQNCLVSLEKSKAFATTPSIWPIISSFTWASVMHRRFWRPLHAAVFQDRTYFLCWFWCKLQADFMKYLELAQNWHSMARFCDWTVYLHVLKWYWLKFSLFTAPLQGAVFTLAHGEDCQWLLSYFRNCNP